jgi:hypothetical protein
MIFEIAVKGRREEKIFTASRNAGHGLKKFEPIGDIA